MPRIKEYKLSLHKGKTKMSTVVPTSYLKDWLEPKLREIGKSLSKDGTNIPEEGNRRWNGAIHHVARRISNHQSNEDQTIDTISRRIHGVLVEESDTTDLGVADVIVLACDEFLSSTGLPVFPAGKQSAMEMVLCYNDIHDQGWTAQEMKDLARKLENFTIGFLNGPRIFGDPAAKERDKKRARNTRVRVKREFQEGTRKTDRRTHAPNGTGGAVRIKRRS